MNVKVISTEFGSLKVNHRYVHNGVHLLVIIISKCLHNRPDGYILNDRHCVCERHHACAEVSSKLNKEDDHQTCKKLGCFYTRKPCHNYSFQNDDTQGFQNILAMCLLGPKQRNLKTCLFHQR